MHRGSLELLEKALLILKEIAFARNILGNLASV